MHIIGLEVENFGRIKAVQIEPDETGAVVISGKNAQGKSSLLNAIWAALGGRAGNTAEKPVRDGADQAKVTVDLGDMIVTRIWRNGTTAVKVQSKDGAEYKSPQTLLDGFIGKLSFDPLEFTRLKSREQKDALLQLVDLDVDLDDLQSRRDEAFDVRTGIGQERKRLGEITVDSALPEDETSAAEILSLLREADSNERELTLLRDRIASREREREGHQRQIAELQSLILDIDGELAEMREQEESSPAPVDTNELNQQLQDLEDVNSQIRENNKAREAKALADSLDAKYESLTKTIQGIDQRKAEALARAAFPVEGLGFAGDGVTFNGVPFSQASSAEQIRVSMAMAIASNPKLRVVRIMDGSLLDEDGMAIITGMAAENDFQCWIERVANGDGVGFVIEDGMLAEDVA